MEAIGDCGGLSPGPTQIISIDRNTSIIGSQPQITNKDKQKKISDSQHWIINNMPYLAIYFCFVGHDSLVRDQSYCCLTAAGAHGTAAAAAAAVAAAAAGREPSVAVCCDGRVCH